MPNELHEIDQLIICLCFCFVEPGLRVVRYAVSGFEYKQCCDQLAMSALAIPIRCVWRKGIGGKAVCRPQAQRNKGHLLCPSLEWLFCSPSCLTVRVAEKTVGGLGS